MGSLRPGCEFGIGSPGHSLGIMSLLIKVLKRAGLLLLIVALAFGAGYLAVSIDLGGEKVEVPNLVGTDARTALETLRGLELQGRQAGEEYHRQIPKGAIVTQRPQAGSRLRKAGMVRYTVSKGTDEVTFPDLVGISLPRAQRALQERGLTLGKVASVHSWSLPKDSILAQYPPSGTRGKRGDTVSLLLSLGPEEAYYLMPDLVGKEQALAFRFLQGLGLDVKVKSAKVSSGLQAGLVVDQDPPSGSQVKAGSQVTIFVGQ